MKIKVCWKVLYSTSYYKIQLKVQSKLHSINLKKLFQHNHLHQHCKLPIQSSKRYELKQMILSQAKEYMVCQTSLAVVAVEVKTLEMKDR